LHDWFGAGRDALIASTRSPEYRHERDRYRAERELTGDESRVAEVSSVQFPQLLDPVDDLPPTSVVTHFKRDGEHVIVRGTTADNGTIKRVVVSGVEARAVASNFAEWEAAVPMKTAEGGGLPQIEAHAEDEAGNVEPRPHVAMIQLDE
jgi:hypothetical protein